MATVNFKIDVMGADKVSAKVGSTLQHAIGRIHQEKFLPTLFGEDLLLFNALATFVQKTGGTETLTLIDRIGSGLPKKGERDVTKPWEDLGNPLKQIILFNNSDTNLVHTFYLKYFETQQLDAKIINTLHNHLTNIAMAIKLTISCEMLNVLTGKVASASDGRSYSGINKLVIPDIATYKDSESGRKIYQKIGAEIVRLSKLFTATTMGVKYDDFILILSREARNALSGALDVYTPETVRGFISNKIIGKRIKDTLTIDSILLNNKFDGKTAGSQTGILAGETYDFKDVHAIIVPKQVFFMKLWKLMLVTMKEKDANWYYTIQSFWGLKDGLIRPELVTYITSK